MFMIQTTVVSSYLELQEKQNIVQGSVNKVFKWPEANYSVLGQLIRCFEY